MNSFIAWFDSGGLNLRMLEEANTALEKEKFRAGELGATAELRIS